MMPLRHIIQNSKTSRLPWLVSKCFEVSSFQARSFCHRSSCMIVIHNPEGRSMKHITYDKFLSGSYLDSMNHQWRFNSSRSQSDKDKVDLIAAQMTMRLLNENSFLSWCRNAYLSSVVGVAMMGGATSVLANTAGYGAFMVGGMNVFWGTSCHVINLIRLRHASGMSGFTLAMHVVGSLFHCFVWLLIFFIYTGVLEHPDHKHRKHANKDRDKDS